MAPLILRRSRQRNQHPDGGHIEHRAGAKIEWTRVLGKGVKKDKERNHLETKKSAGFLEGIMLRVKLYPWILA
jgi:hypothetical protein